MGFVCFHWVYLLFNKRIDNELDKPVPASFEHLRQMLQAQSPMCQYLLNTNKPTNWNFEGLAEELNKISNSSLKIMKVEFWTNIRYRFWLLAISAV